MMLGFVPLPNLQISDRASELYIVTGASGSQDTFTRPDKPGLNVNIPSNLWKVVLVLDDPGSGVSDINENTLAFAVYAPNDDSVLERNWRNAANGYVRPVRDVENLTNYNFLSNIPIHIQNQIEQIPQNQLYQRINDLFDSLPNASLLADSTQFGNSGPTTIIADRTIGHNGFTEDICSIRNKLYCPQEVGRLKTTASVSSFDSTFPQVSSGKISSQTAMEFNQFSSLQISPNKHSSINTSTPESSIAQVGFTEISSNQLASRKVGISQISAGQIGTGQISPFKSSSTQVCPIQIGSNQFDSFHFGIGQIDSSQISQDKVSIFDDDSREVSFTSGIPFEQTFSSHNITPQIISNLNNSATNIWSDLLQYETQLDIDFQITDLPAGQLAEATIAGFDSSGKPNAGKILIDYDANGVGWFIDETPLDNSEFTTQNSNTPVGWVAQSKTQQKRQIKDYID